MSKSTITSIIAVVVLVIAVILIVVIMPGKSNKGTNSSGTNSSTAFTSKAKAADKTAIENNVKTFFAANTTMATRENLLQNGSKFAQPMQAEFSQLDNEKPSVIINSINFTNQTTAKVNYTVDLNNQPVLKNQTGEALYITKTWKVSDSTLCQLLSMGGSNPSVCKNIN